MALVVMGLLNWQPRLGAIQGLNLALFVHAEDDWRLWRDPVKTHHVGHLLQKLRVARQLESLRAMWLQIVGAPDIVDGGLADALAPCHGPATPVGHPCWLSLQGSLHNSGDLIYSINGLSSPPRSNVPQTVQTLLTKALPPQNHRIAGDRELLRNRDIGPPGSGSKTDPTAQRHVLCSPMRPDPLLEFVLSHGRRLT